MNILLLASNDLAALNSSRIFNNQNFRVFNIYLTKKTPLNYSNSVYKSSYIGNPFCNYNIFKKNLSDYIKNNKIQIILPINDIATDIIFDCKKELDKICQLIIPNEEAYRIARNKLESLHLAEKLQIPVPKYKVLRDLNVPNISYPCYLKPLSSTLISADSCYSFSVKKVVNKTEMIDFLRETINILPVMAQENIDGYGLGVNVFCKKGKIITHTVNKRIHEPPHGGGSSYRKSIRLDPTLREYVEALVTAMKLDGAMMFEFKATNNEYVLMEINPRLWGSLSVSTFSGVNFPMLMLGRNNNEYKNYNYGLYSRNLRKDLKWIFCEINRSKNLFCLIKWLGTFRRIILQKEVFDVEDIKDLKPALYQFFIQIDSFLEKCVLLLKKYIYQLVGKQKSLHLRKYEKILFVCKGNINRSAFAEKYLKNFYPSIFCSSAGTLLKRGRKTTSKGIISAEKFGVNLKNHISQTIYDINLEYFNKILVFDWENYISFLDVYPNFSSKVFLIDSGNSKGYQFIKPKEIKDPFGKSQKDYYRCFKKIKISIEKIFKISTN